MNQLSHGFSFHCTHFISKSQRMREVLGCGEVGGEDEGESFVCRAPPKWGCLLLGAVWWPTSLQVEQKGVSESVATSSPGLAVALLQRCVASRQWLPSSADTSPLSFLRICSHLRSSSCSHHLPRLAEPGVTSWAHSVATQGINKLFLPRLCPVNWTWYSSKWLHSVLCLEGK